MKKNFKMIIVAIAVAVGVLVVALLAYVWVTEGLGSDADCKLNVAETHVDTYIRSDKPDFGYTVRLVVANRGEAGDIIIKASLSTSEGSFARQETLHFAAGQEMERAYEFHEPSVDANNVQSYVECKPSSASPQTVHTKVDKVNTLIGELITIPTGSFIMGSNKFDNEKPSHTVMVRSFRLMKNEVTFDQYDTFARATGRELPNDQGWGRGSRPVINVSWDDAQAFAQWVSQQTGTRVRLPSEAEWEYAARAGTTTEYWWGNNPDPKYARYEQDSTVPVGSYPANPWGLHDTAGNVWEWVQDCYHDSYNGAPTNGSARESEQCSRRVDRGGSWYLYPFYMRSAYRFSYAPTKRYDFLGIRLAQDL